MCRPAFAPHLKYLLPGLGYTPTATPEAAGLGWCKRRCQLSWRRFWLFFSLYNNTRRHHRALCQNAQQIVFCTRLFPSLDGSRSPGYRWDAASRWRFCSILLASIQDAAAELAGGLVCCGRSVALSPALFSDGNTGRSGACMYCLPCTMSKVLQLLLLYF